MMMDKALIGYTGFVGSNLLAKTHYEGLYNSSNIEKIMNSHVSEVVCAGINAVKWRANKEPELDWKGIEKLANALKTITVDRFTLISTVDVYRKPLGVDEDSVDFEAKAAYGKHRRKFEEIISNLFPAAQIVRLPALFGPGLKKNVIYDLMNGNMLEAINADAEFQWYNVARLASDLDLLASSTLKVLNVACEPIATSAIIKTCFPDRLNSISKKDGPPPRYDMRTRHAEVLNGRGHYHILADQILKDIRDFVSLETKR